MSQLEHNNIAARLKQRIAFEKPIYVLDSLAATQTTWQRTEEAWAEIIALSGKERELSDSIVTSASYRVFVSKYHNVKPEMRILYDGKILTIRAIINNPRHSELIEILAHEEKI